MEYRRSFELTPEDGEIVIYPHRGFYETEFDTVLKSSVKSLMSPGVRPACA
jgi:hypothetical protein